MDSGNFKEKFKLKELIGCGKSAEVYKASYITEDGEGKMTVAARKFNTTINTNSLKEQFKILLCLQHENIVKYLDLFTTEDRTIMLMEYADCGSLYDFLDDKDKKEWFPKDRRINWMRQCAKGLAHLHSKYFINHNLNSKDLLLTNNYKSLKICCIKIIRTNEMENSSSKRENNNFLQKEIFDFGMILLGVISHTNLCSYSQGDNISEVSKSVPERIGNIRNYANLTHIKTLIENCTINVAANTCLPTMDEVEFILGINCSADLEYIKKVGSGSFGLVYKAKWVSEDGTTKIVAAKKLSGIDKINGIHREITTLSRVKHKNIVSFLGITMKDGKLVILMEYADCGSVYDGLHGQDRFDSASIPKRRWMLQCAKGLAYLHEQNIMHRDLKTKNLVLTNRLKTLKICDFGLVKNVETTNTSVMGTYGYMAPEVCQERKYTAKCDVFSYGIVLWEIMSEKKPFYELEGMHFLAQQRKVNEGYRPKQDDAEAFGYFDYIKTIMEQCWSHEEENRPTMQEVILSLDKVNININKSLSYYECLNVPQS